MPQPPRPKRYRLYIDESGSHVYKNLENPRQRYLGLLGCIINDETYSSSIVPRINRLKCRFFTPGIQTVLHRTDIIERRGPFSILNNPQTNSEFDADLLECFRELRYGLICVVINKLTHMERYPRTAFPPYHYCMQLMLERYCYFLNRFRCVGDVMAEARGKSDDQLLQAAFSAVFAGGTKWHRPEHFQKVLTSKEIKFRKKFHNINGLQLADLLAHPVKQAVLLSEGVTGCEDGPFGDKVRIAVAEKYNRNFEDGRVKGYGMALLK